MTDYDPTDDDDRALGASAIHWACNADQRCNGLASALIVNAGFGAKPWVSWDLWRLDQIEVAR